MLVTKLKSFFILHPDMDLMAGRKPQSNVITGGKAHALFLTIHLSNAADSKLCCSALKKIPDLIKEANKNMPASHSDIIYGVGFSEDYYRKIGGNSSENFEYKERKGELGTLPSTGGDIFLHAKCDKRGTLFDLCRLLIASFPPNCIDHFQDIYGFTYRDNRDLSGFIDGINNPSKEAEIMNVAVNSRTLGSYAVAQKWVHNFEKLENVPVEEQEQWIGRERANGNELKEKSVTSHVARMKGGNEYQQKPKFRLYRQSMPFGTLSEEAGLFFIGFSNGTEALNFMLDQMVGISDGFNDDVMKFSQAVTGNYYYFPNREELQELLS